MSLEGNLEELGLGEILQIVSLSKKTGVLSLSSKGRDGSVFFRQGQVVRATSSSYRQSLGDVLIQRGVIDLAMLRKGLAYQQKCGFRERLGVILVNNFGVLQETVDEVVREQIENTVFSLFDWSEGTFRFEVHNSIETVAVTNMNPLQFMLDQGLNPQFLAMEGGRILDEMRHATGTGFAGGEPPDGTANSDYHLPDGVGASALPRHIVIVDDDGPTLRTIADSLAEKGFVVHAMTRSEDTLIKVDSLHRDGERPAVLIDLIMPKMDGSGVLGGIELLGLLRNNFKDLQLIVMTDYHHAEAEQKIREFGYPFVVKPRRAEINTPAIIGDFLTQVTHAILRSADSEPSDEWPSRFNLGDELRIEMGEDDDMPLAVEPSPQSGGISLLRGMLEELNNPDLQGGVLLLVLRFASEFVNRAIIFTVKDRVISGFGQFGIAGGPISGDERVRSIHIPQESGSMFSNPLRTGQAYTFSPTPTPVDFRIFDKLGGGTPPEAFIGPLISQSRVVGFLYGDNLPDRKQIGDVEPLAIFLSQAGLSMEKSFLERQLNERGTP
jgi:CheY-like chemotaxis protein